jgi:hypothetical protein
MNSFFPIIRLFLCRIRSAGGVGGLASQASARSPGFLEENKN